MGAKGSSHAALWRDVMEQTTAQTKKVQEELMTKVKSEFKENKTVDDAEIMKLAQEAAKQFDSQNKAMLERVWKAYDENGDESLDQEECKKLMREMLTEQQKFAPKIIEVMLDSSIQLSLDLLKSMNLEPDELKKATTAVKEQMQKIKSEQKNAVANMAKALLEQSDELSGKLFKQMDTDGNKQVSKEEFFANYDKATKEIVNMEAMMAKLSKGSAAGPGAGAGAGKP